MRIGIDIDDTITYSNELYVKEALKYDKKRLRGTGYVDKNEYKLDGMFDWSKEEKYDFFRYILNYSFKNVKMIPDANKIINKLYDEGYEIYFITARSKRFIDDPVPETAKWLQKHGFKYHKLITEAREKGVVCLNNKVDLFIDDAINQCEDVSSYDIPVILFEYQYNQNCTKFKKTNSWLEIYKIIKEMGNGKNN